MISVIKNIRMFVVHSILRGGKARQISAGIFYALADHIYVYGFVPPCRVLMDLLPLRWNATGKAEPFFYFIFRWLRTKLSVMHSTEKTCSRAKHSTPSTTANARQALVHYFTENYPPVKRLKIKDHKNFFVARARYGKRVLHAKAYSLERLVIYFRQEFETKVLALN